MDSWHANFSGSSAIDLAPRDGLGLRAVPCAHRRGIFGVGSRSGLQWLGSGGSPASSMRELQT